MKTFFKTIALAVVVLFTADSVSAQISAGITDSRYVYGCYALKSKIKFKIEHSLYSEKVGFQRVGVGVGYEKQLPLGFSLGGSVMGATTWNRNYQLVSAEASLKYDYRRVGLEAVVNPRYDSGLHYDTCWKAGAKVKISDPISVCMDYSTIPLYRMSEQRLSGGFEFSVLNLRVTPELSVSMEKTTRLKNMRVLMSMNYEF